MGTARDLEECPRRAGAVQQANRAHVAATWAWLGVAGRGWWLFRGKSGSNLRQLPLPETGACPKGGIWVKKAGGPPGKGECPLHRPSAQVFAEAHRGSADVRQMCRCRTVALREWWGQVRPGASSGGPPDWAACSMGCGPATAAWRGDPSAPGRRLETGRGAALPGAGRHGGSCPPPHSFPQREVPAAGVWDPRLHLSSRAKWATFGAWRGFYLLCIAQQLRAQILSRSPCSILAAFPFSILSCVTWGK